MSKLLLSFVLTILLIVAIGVFMFLVASFVVLMNTRPVLVGGIGGGVCFLIIWSYVHGEVTGGNYR